MAFRKLLIANRGEIACRIIRSCQLMGIHTVAVYSEADRDALHVRMADEARLIGGPRPTDSYLNIDAVLAAALDSGAEAVHPGYGFLSENADFARRCATDGLVFVGPTVETMEQMASKAEAKRVMEAAGVPTVPGYHGEDQDPDVLKSHAEGIGYPLMIKAAAGGGGKGMRIVHGEQDFDAALEGACRESRNAFGDDRVILERYLEQPRHVEVQVFGDQFGNVVHLFERDCSSQRRYQKIIEESPAPGLDDEQRAAMHTAGVDAARAVNYLNAGTVEFIVDASGEFFFMEMNTRLQVEHPVTEMVTGLDLVAWQLKVAAGEPLPLEQDQISLTGHAMEARVYAEDPASGFLPSSGRIHWLHWPNEARIETGVEQGAEVTVHYDPMIAKLVVHGEDRNQAIERLLEALAGTALAGPHSNLDFLSALASNQRFATGDMHTAFLDAHLDEVYPSLAEPPAAAIAAAATVQLLYQEHESREAQAFSQDPHSPWATADGWRLGHYGRRVISLKYGDDHHLVNAIGHDGSYQLSWGERQISIEDASWINGRLEMGQDGKHLAITVQFSEPWLQVQVGGRLIQLVAEDPFAVEDSDDAAQDRVMAPMPGRIVAVKTKPGKSVKQGQVVIIMEAMKMELTLTAPRNGVIDSVRAEEGEFVEADSVLIELKTL
jgi:3-methylcrotonyl-CoA carboxylase alpha subunit